MADTLAKHAIRKRCDWIEFESPPNVLENLVKDRSLMRIGGILIGNKMMSNLEEVMIHQEEKSCVPEGGPSSHCWSVGEPELPVEDQPAPKICSLSKLSSSKIKKKKTRRKARRWSRRSST
nr:uncharacterized protein LOC109165045 isoform X1 [Ipomoea trifida]